MDGPASPEQPSLAPKETPPPMPEYSTPFQVEVQNPGRLWQLMNNEDSSVDCLDAEPISALGKNTHIGFADSRLSLDIAFDRDIKYPGFQPKTLELKDLAKDPAAVHNLELLLQNHIDPNLRITGEGKGTSMEIKMQGGPEVGYISLRRDAFHYSPGVGVTSQEQFEEQLQKGLKIFQIYITELYKANGLDVPASKLTIRPDEQEARNKRLAEIRAEYNKPAAEGAQVPEELKAGLVELLQPGRILSPEEKIGLSRLLTEAKASIAGNVEIDPATKLRLGELVKVLKDHYKRVEMARGVSMGAYWIALAESQSDIGADLTRVLPDSEQQTLFWNKIVEILETAKGEGVRGKEAGSSLPYTNREGLGLTSRAYVENLPNVYAEGNTFKGMDYLTESEKFIREQFKQFVAEAGSKNANEIFIAAKEKLASFRDSLSTFRAQSYLSLAGIKVLEATVDEIETPEEKLAWAFVERSMEQYTRDHFVRFFRTSAVPS